jgi:hypothetical protein
MSTACHTEIGGYMTLGRLGGRGVGCTERPLAKTHPETLPYALVAGGSPVKSLVGLVTHTVRAPLLPMSDG